MDWELVVGVGNFFAMVHMVQTPCMTLEVSAFTLPSTCIPGIHTLSPGFRVSVPVPYVFLSYIVLLLLLSHVRYSPSRSTCHHQSLRCGSAG